MKKKDKRNTPLSPQAKQEISALKADFNQDIQAFFARNKVEQLPQFSLDPDHHDATVHYLITGASFTPYEDDSFVPHPTHSTMEVNHTKKGQHAKNEGKFVLNNSAAIAKNLLDQGKPVICHTGNPALMEKLFANHPHRDKLTLFTGDLAAPSILTALYQAVADSGQKQPIAEIRPCLYKSFAQGADEPFKPIHNEDPANIENAATGRFRFSYLMMVFAYDLLVNKKQGHLRVVVLSALAASRASYGLMADAADKFANELAWKSFHKEANIALDQAVTLYQVCPGITTACDIYDRDSVRKIVLRESIADGFPFDDNILNGKKPMPQVSAGDIAALTQLLLVTDQGKNPNKAIDPDLQSRLESILWGGYDRDSLLRKLRQATSGKRGKRRDGFRFGGRGELPDHIFAPDTYYGRLPKKIRKGDYARISITPKGQRF